MPGLLALLVLGFFLGLRHATDPDHVIAVTTIVAREKTPSGATAIGAAWGIGHMVTILIVGGGIILFGWVIPPKVGLAMEFFVGLMLIVLGLMNLRTRTHSHEHALDANSDGVERPPVKWLDRHFGALRSYRLVRPLVVGVVHGLAGSAAIALLVLTTIRNPVSAIWYLLVFGTGTIVGMMLMTAVIIVPFKSTNQRFPRLQGRLRMASGVVSLAFGLFIAYRAGMVDGLFSGNPHWTPE